MVDINISSSSTSKWIDITTTLYNYDVELDQEMQHTPHISFNLKEIDIKGSFEADDEVGFVFKEIQLIADDLTNTINEAYEQ